MKSQNRLLTIELFFTMKASSATCIWRLPWRYFLSVSQMSRLLMKPDKRASRHKVCRGRLDVSGRVVVTHMSVEDDVAVNGGGLVHALLDDYENAVRQWRVHDDESETQSNFGGAWFERVWNGDFQGERGEVGPAYQVCGRRCPPYSSEDVRRNTLE